MWTSEDAATLCKPMGSPQGKKYITTHVFNQIFFFFLKTPDISILTLNIL